MKKNTKKAAKKRVVSIAKGIASNRLGDGALPLDRLRSELSVMNQAMAGEQKAPREVAPAPSVSAFDIEHLITALNMQAQANRANSESLLQASSNLHMRALAHDQYRRYG